VNVGLRREEMGGLVDWVVKKKEGFCGEVLGIFGEKMGEMEGEIDEVNDMKMNVEEGMEWIVDEGEWEEGEEWK
ncbi:hypothetical protein, partial [Paenibacillus sp. Y412MC10]|uniref:hypothetical protein n=1 Tax=Geobacillus sp. (strain Y412MC10) TaxID=481743 RepID=UPI0037C5E3BD